MKESVQAALSLLKSRATQLGIPLEQFGQYDVHIHVPAGAIPKTAPPPASPCSSRSPRSFTGRPVSPNVAMTGEISLRGLVLPIGGLKEKLNHRRASRVPRR
jgi:ATP-dependent Lon protease